MAASLISQGLELAMVGMGTVFVFLTVLVFATMIMSSLVTRFAPGEPEARIASRDAGAADGELVAVITAAVRRHRAERRR